MSEQADTLNLIRGIATELGFTLDVVRQLLPYCQDPYLAEKARQLLARNDEAKL